MVDITETLDCTGEVCPYPDVKSKIKVKKAKLNFFLFIIFFYFVMNANQMNFISSKIFRS